MPQCASVATLDFLSMINKPALLALPDVNIAAALEWKSASN